MFRITLPYLRAVVCGVGALLVFAAVVDLHSSGSSTTFIVRDEAVVKASDGTERC